MPPFEFEVTSIEMITKRHEPDLNKWPNWPTGAYSVFYNVKYKKTYHDPEGALSMPPEDIEEGNFTIEGNHERLDAAIVAAATLMVQTLYIHSHF